MEYYHCYTYIPTKTTHIRKTKHQIIEYERKYVYLVYRAYRRDTGKQNQTPNMQKHNTITDVLGEGYIYIYIPRPIDDSGIRKYNVAYAHYTTAHITSVDKLRSCNKKQAIKGFYFFTYLKENQEREAPHEKQKTKKNTYTFHAYLPIYECSLLVSQKLA